MKPYYDDGTITIYNGDCREILPTLVAHVLVTDPPYGTGTYATDTEVLTAALLCTWITQFATVAVFGWPESLVGLCSAAAVTPSEWVTWWPTNKPQARCAGLPRETEHIAIFGDLPGRDRLKRPRSQAGTDIIKALPERTDDPFEARLGDVWRDPSPGVMFNSHQRLHPNEKPLSLMSKFVQLCSDPTQIVVDPFSGSGTTLRAAKDNSRRAIGIELEERYCEIAAERCAQDVFDLGEAA